MNSPDPQQGAATPDALPARTTPTWEMEMLLSGATVFGLLQLPDVLHAATEPMLAVLIKRHYHEHEISEIPEYAVHGRPFAGADYVLDGRPSHLVTTVADIDEIVPGSTLADDLADLIAARPVGSEGVIDLYLRWPDAPEDDDEASATLAQRFAALPVAHEIRRIAIGVVAGGGREVGYFTLRPAGDGTLFEDLLVRNVHPMVGRRLSLWRLRDFDLTRLDGPTDVLLLQGKAKDNPADERLFALAQVRQFSVVRDDTGRVTSLPHLERAIANCLEGIRRTRAARGAHHVGQHPGGMQHAHAARAGDRAPADLLHPLGRCGARPAGACTRRIVL